MNKIVKISHFSPNMHFCKFKAPFQEKLILIPKQ